MPVPQRRNEKKSRRMVYKPYRGQPLLRGYEQGRQAIEEGCDDPLAGLSFEERLEMMPYPGRWLDEQAQGDSLGERLLGGRGRLLQDSYDAEDEVDPDIGHDFDDFY